MIKSAAGAMASKYMHVRVHGQPRRPGRDMTVNLNLKVEVAPVTHHVATGFS